MACAGLALLLVTTQIPPPGIAPALWQHLRGWEAVMAGTTSLTSERGTKTETDRAGVTRTYDATVWFLKPNRLRMRLDRQPPAGQKPNPNDYTTYICNDRSIFEYDGLTQAATEYPRAPIAGFIGDHPLMDVMSGRMTARQMAQRYTIDWVRTDDPTYLILEFVPLRPQDKFEFDKMTLVLVKPDLPPPLDQLAYLPRLARIVKHHAGAVETWDFPEPRRNPVKPDGQPVGVADFEPLAPPAGWREAKPTARPPSAADPTPR